MTLAIKIMGMVKNGVFKPFYPELQQKQMMALEGKVTIASYRQQAKHRTIPQNKYYFGVVVPILADYCGYTKGEMHDALKMKFLRKHNDTVPGCPDTSRSTTDLSTVEFNEYIENIRAWAVNEFMVHIPDPNEWEDEDES